jgi:hypothetical protein
VAEVNGPEEMTEEHIVALRDAGFRLAVGIAASRGDSELIQSSINGLQEDVAKVSGGDHWTAIRYMQFAEGAAFSVLAQLIEGARLTTDHIAGEGLYDRSLQETVAEWYQKFEGKP